MFRLNPHAQEIGDRCKGKPPTTILGLTVIRAGSLANANTQRNALGVCRDVSCWKSFRPIWRRTIWAFKLQGKLLLAHSSYYHLIIFLISVRGYQHFLIVIFVSFRKPSESVVYEEESNHKYRKRRNRSHTVSEKPVNAFQKTESDNIGNGYLDLASGGDSHLCRYDRYLHAVICSSARHATSGYHQKQTQTPRPSRPHHHHTRSRSHDTPAPVQTPPRVLQIIFL